MTYCDVNMFADDTIFYVTGKTIDDVNNKLQSDLENVYNWLCCNKLSLHLGKTCCMVIGTYKKLINKPKS